MTTLRDVAAAKVADFRADHPGVTPTWNETHWVIAYVTHSDGVAHEEWDPAFDDYLRACQAAWAEA